MKVLTFGEALFRLSTHKGERLAQAQNLNFCLGGTELNIAANLRSLGVDAEWVSCLPDGVTGELILNKLSQLGVNSSHCQIIPEGRAGWYLVETGSSPRPDVVFNRYASSLCEVKNFEIPWNKILKDSSCFHTSGVTAGLSLVLTQEVEKAMQEARNLGVLVSYDFNYRKNIWSLDEFKKRQKPLLSLIDILFCSESDLEIFFGKDPKIQNYDSIFQQTNLKYLVLSERSADEGEYGIRLVTREGQYRAKSYPVHNLDRIGVGDSMAAGFLSALLKKASPEEAAESASAAGALKYSIQGDMALLREAEIRELIKSGVKGIIR